MHKQMKTEQTKQKLERIYIYTDRFIQHALEACNIVPPALPIHLSTDAPAQSERSTLRRKPCLVESEQYALRLPVDADDEA